MNDSEFASTIKDPFAQIHMTTHLDSVIARGRALRRRHLAAAGAAVAAGAAATALAVSVLVPATGSPARVSLAAWTVTREPGGTVAVTIRNLNNPDALTRKLQHDGVRANFSGNIPAISPAGRINRECLEPATTNPAVRRALTVRTISNPHLAAFLLHPSAIPAGDTLSIYWAAVSAHGFPAGTRQRAGGRILVPSASRSGARKVWKQYTIPLTLAGDFAFDAVLLNSAGNCE